MSFIPEISIDTMNSIQRRVDKYDLKSLVFLLYDIPETALQGILYSGDVLQNWALHNKSKPFWRDMLVEALAICRLFGIIRRLGLDVNTVKSFYSPQDPNTSVYINQVKKLLYISLCEKVTSADLIIMKNKVKQLNIDVEALDDAESLILRMLSEKIIKLNDLENLVSVIEDIPSLDKLRAELENKQTSDNIKVHPITQPNHEHLLPKDVKEAQNNLAKTTIVTVNKITSDDINLDCYDIKNPSRVGFAYIINQEKFYSHLNLPNRQGSTRDKHLLHQVLTKFKFKVHSVDNLTSDEIMKNIQYVVETFVHDDDSVFMLCILSHGIRGHIYGVDGNPVKVESIQKLIDTAGNGKLRNVPKVLIIQSCQVDKESEECSLESDSPIATNYLNKSDYLIHWATAPEYEAFRDPNKGSIFIYKFCCILKEFGDKEHLNDICTKVNYTVTKLCLDLRKEQLPIIESTLRKKLYLCNK